MFGAHISKPCFRENMIFQDHLKHILYETDVRLYTFSGCWEKHLSTHIRNKSKLIFLDSLLFQDHLKHILYETDIRLYRFSGCWEKVLSTHIRNDQILILSDSLIFQHHLKPILHETDVRLYTFWGCWEKASQHAHSQWVELYIFRQLDFPGSPQAYFIWEKCPPV